MGHKNDDSAYNQVTCLYLCESEHNYFLHTSSRILISSNAPSNLPIISPFPGTDLLRRTRTIDDLTNTGVSTMNLVQPSVMDSVKLKSAGSKIAF
jgi:hypothetical protein